MNLAEMLTEQQDKGASAVVGALLELGVMRLDLERDAYVFEARMVAPESLYDVINRRLGRK